MKILLHVENLGMRFGGLVAVDDVSFTMHAHQIMAVIGPNGAGKTTAFNCISGFYTPTQGRVELSGKCISDLPGHDIARLGLVRTFQNIRLFNNMTVTENLLVAQHCNVNTGLLAGLFKTPDFRKKEKQAMEKTAYWLEQVGLLEFANRQADTLAYGQQRRLEIARCMVTSPKLLLLDEPAAGLNPNETADLDQLIMRLRDDHGVSILLIEHDMSLVMGISDKIVVLDQGCNIASGTPAEIRENPDVIRAYLGEE